MKVLFYCPDWGNRWIPYIKDELSVYDCHFTHSPGDVESLSEQADVLISGWLDAPVAFWTKNFPDKKIISWCRRYEIFESEYKKNINISKIDAMIFVSEFWRDYFTEKWEKPDRSYVIKNGIDISQFKLKARSETKKIAMVCQLRGIKNIPLAIEILQYPYLTGHTLHQIGLPGENLSYLDPYIENFGLKDRVFFEGQTDDVAGWLEDKEFILSTSINEGCPNNILEAMAMGIKPIINNWPGAKELFPNSYVFNTAEHAVEKIQESYYQPVEYRKLVEDNHSLSNFKKIHDVIKEVV